MSKNHYHDARRPVTCAVLTVSDTRTADRDKSGKLIMNLLTDLDHQVKVYKIIPDEKNKIQQTIKDVIHHHGINAVIVTGGTGIARRDVTIEAIQPLFDKELPGFGELFRVLSYQFDIGSAAILSRAVAGVANNRIIFSIPGSTGAVRLAMERLILPELSHIVGETEKE